MKSGNVISFPLEKEDIMRLKPEDICGRVWKTSKYGSADIDLNNDRVKLKVIQPPAKSNISPKIIEKFDDYIEDTAENMWHMFKRLFKKI